MSKQEHPYLRAVAASSETTATGFKSESGAGRLPGVDDDTDALVEEMFAGIGLAKENPAGSVPGSPREESGVKPVPRLEGPSDEALRRFNPPLGDWARPYVGKIPSDVLRRLSVAEEDGGYSPAAREEMLRGWERGTFSFSKQDRATQRRSRALRAEEDELITQDLATRIHDFEDVTNTRLDSVPEEEVTQTMEDETRVFSRKKDATRKPLPELPNLKTLSGRSARTERAKNTSLPNLPLLEVSSDLAIGPPPVVRETVHKTPTKAGTFLPELPNLKSMPPASRELPARTNVPPIKYRAESKKVRTKADELPELPSLKATVVLPASSAPNLKKDKPAPPRKVPIFGDWRPAWWPWKG